MSHGQINLLDEIIVDNFAGGGGASTGIELATGRVVDIAINHDPDAILMHRTNHPHTMHYQASVWDVDPVEVCGGRQVGLAWFSPDCKHFSKAKGGKPVDKNIRGLAWIVLRWAGTVRPRVIILENVEEFQTWGPVRRGRPVKSKTGQTFRQWLGQLEALGYVVEWRELVAADYGAPTTRKRFFLIARSDGRHIVWPEPTHAPADSQEVKAGTKKPWRSAAEIIDWNLPTPSVFATKEEIRERYGVAAVRPLAKNTMRRVARGVDKFVIRSASPFLVIVNHAGEFRGQGLADHHSKTWVWRGLPCHGTADHAQQPERSGHSYHRAGKHDNGDRSGRPPNADHPHPGGHRPDGRRGPLPEYGGANPYPGFQGGGVRGVSGHDPVSHRANRAGPGPGRY